MALFAAVREGGEPRASERARRALTALSEMRAMLEGVRVLHAGTPPDAALDADSETHPALIAAAGGGSFWGRG
jgi:hypothetical protein